MKDFFTHNALLKGVSLLLALALWFYIVGEERAEVGLSIPLELINVAPDLIVTSDVPRDISVRVNGPRRLLRMLQTESLHKAIDLTGAQAGTSYFRIPPDSLFMPHGVRVISVSPDAVRLVLERSAESELSIFPSLDGSPEEGYAVTSVLFTPEKVRVRGPESVLGTLHAAWTKPISVKGKRSTFKTEVALDIKSLHVTVSNKKPIMAEVRIEEIPVARTYGRYPIHVVNAPGPYTLRPDQVEVSVAGPRSAVERNVLEKTLEVQLDLEDLPPGRHLKQVTARAPQGVTLVDVSPSIIEVMVMRPEPNE